MQTMSLNAHTSSMAFLSEKSFRNIQILLENLRKIYTKIIWYPHKAALLNVYACFTKHEFIISNYVIYTNKNNINIDLIN